MKSIIIILLSALSITAFAQQDQVEIAPFSNAGQSTTMQDSLNLQFSFPTIAFVGEYGVETDGSNVYVTQWLDDSIATYNQAGNVLEEFVIPGVGRTRDLAWDGQYYYGSPNEFYFYVLDMANKTLINTIQTSFKVRGMAYDPIEDVLWASEHWSPAFYKMDKQGNILDQWFPSGVTMDAISGLAYDNFSPGGPFLWGFSQDSTGAMIVKYDITNQAQTGNMIDVSGLVTEVAYAGGLFVHQMEQRDVPTLGGMIQNQLVFSLELSYANMLVGIETNEVIKLLEVYPNPATEVLNIRYQMPDPSTTLGTGSGYQMIEIISLSGERVHAVEVEDNSAGEHKIAIDVSTLPTGTYFVRMQLGNNIVTKKVVVAH